MGDNNIIINLNQECKVKLDKTAIDYLQFQKDTLNKIYNTDFKINIDKDGYYHTQLHNLFRDFGPILKGSYSPFRNCEIIIIK